MDTHTVPSPLRRRIAPTVPLTLTLEVEGGEKWTRNFRLSFDFNATCRIEQMTGQSVLNGEVFRNPNATTLSIMLWATVCATHPEYDYDPKTDEDEETCAGLVAIRSYMDSSNVRAITVALSDAFLASLPEADRTRIKTKVAGGESPDPTAPPVTDAAGKTAAA